MRSVTAAKSGDAGSEELQQWKSKLKIFPEAKTIPIGETVSTMSVVQCKDQTTPENKTGLPDRLKAGIESLSGTSMDDVKVHYNSANPSQLNALAYTQGSDIYVGPGQEQHLAHETWHVVQQKQGRVKPTTQMKGVEINSNPELESEAEMMGHKALSTFEAHPLERVQTVSADTSMVQRKENVIQLYPDLALGNANGISEEKYATGNGSIVFTYFDSCFGVVGRNGTNLTGIHLVYVGNNEVSLMGANDDGDQNKATTAVTIASLVDSYDEVKLVGDIAGWNQNASFFMQSLRTRLNTAVNNNLAIGQNQENGEWMVTYDAHNGWSYVNLRNID